MNAQLNKQLHTLLSASGLMNEKANLVLGFSDGKSESSKGLTDSEAREMISYLQKQKNDEKNAPTENKMRRKMISMAHEMHWRLTGAQKVDMLRLNGWCIHYGYLHKKLNDYTYIELPKLVTQFTRVCKDYLNKI